MSRCVDASACSAARSCSTRWPSTGAREELMRRETSAFGQEKSNTCGPLYGRATEGLGVVADASRHPGSRAVPRLLAHLRYWCGAEHCRSDAFETNPGGSAHVGVEA